MKIKKILVYLGDSELGNEILNSLKYCKDIVLFSASEKSLNEHFPFHKKHFKIPLISEENGINALNTIIQEYNIDFIYPSTEKSAIELLEQRELNRTPIISSPLETLLILESKSKFQYLFKNTFYINEKYNNEMEKCTSKEYIIGCISDRKRGLLYCVGFENLEKNDSHSYIIKLESKDFFNFCANEILKEIKLFGGWSFILRRESQKTFKLIKITPHFEFLMGIHRLVGVNFPLLSIYEGDRDKFQILSNNYDISYKGNFKKLNVILNCDYIYVDLDDTLIIKNTLNIQLHEFLKKSHANGKKIILISKHHGDIKKTLQDYKISLVLFENIIHLKDRDEKFQYVKEMNSIFIDDSYHERKKIFDKLKIPIFDICMIDGLIF